MAGQLFDRPGLTAVPWADEVLFVMAHPQPWRNMKEAAKSDVRKNWSVQEGEQRQWLKFLAGGAKKTILSTEGLKIEWHFQLHLDYNKE